MTEPKLQKVGTLKVKNGTYTDDTGREKNRYHEIGIVLATPHHSRLCIKLHANGFGEGQFANVFYDEGKAPRAQSDDTERLKSPDSVGAEPLALDPEIKF
jgi:hypothetical protein